jgi:hypothetical protein
MLHLRARKVRKILFYHVNHERCPRTCSVFCSRRPTASTSPHRIFLCDRTPYTGPTTHPNANGRSCCPTQTAEVAPCTCISHFPKHTNYRHQRSSPAGMLHWAAATSSPSLAAGRHRAVMGPGSVAPFSGRAHDVRPTVDARGVLTCSRPA